MSYICIKNILLLLITNQVDAKKKQKKEADEK